MQRYNFESGFKKIIKESGTSDEMIENSALVALSLHLSNLKAGLQALDAFRKSMPSFDKQSKSKRNNCF